jgi:uncharacterized protein (TIGR00725 family)
MEEKQNTNLAGYNGPLENNSKHGHSKIKIGVSGAAETGHCGLNALDLAKNLGHEIVKQGGVLITGATSGFPLWVSMGAKEERGVVIGFSPATSEKEHIEAFRLPTDYTDLIIYTGFGYSGRDLLFTRACDAIIFGCGRIGTIHEFTIAYEDGKPIGLLKGPWVTDTEIEDIIKDGNVSSDNVVIDDDPKRLLEKVIKKVEERKALLYKNH